MKTRAMKHLLGILAFTFLGQTISAQNLSRSVLASGGSSFSSTALQADWTIGETVVGLFNGSNLLVCQGFQQGPDADATAVEQPWIQPFRLWPNPTTGLLTLQHLGQTAHATPPILWSPDGKRISIFWEQNADRTWQSNISHLAAGTYLVQIGAGDQRRVMRVLKF
jgi:hypothetical protein